MFLLKQVEMSWAIECKDLLHLDFSKHTKIGSF